MAICKANAIYETYRQGGAYLPFDSPTYYGSHLWKQTYAERVWEMAPRKEWHPTSWYEHILKFFWNLLGGSVQDITDIQDTGKIRRVYYCQYCRERDEVVTTDVSG